MNEQKEYISQIRENGSLHISEYVLASIAGITISEVEGVAAAGSGIGSEIVDILGKKNLGKGVRIAIGEDNEITVDCSIVVNVGSSIVDVARSVQDTVFSNIENVTGFRPAAVNVTVAGVALPREQKK